MPDNQQPDPGPALAKAAARAAENLAEKLQQAVALHQAGQLQRAEAIYRWILGRAADHADTNYLLGTLNLQQGRHEKAVPLLQKALAADPANSTALSNLGVALKALGRFEEAIAAYKAVLDQQPDNASALNNLGVAHMALDDAAAAAKNFRLALAAKPGYVEAANNLGRALQAMGELGEAADAYRQAIRLMPDCAEAHLALTALGPVQRQHRATLQKLYEDKGLGANQRLYLAFALGKACEDGGDFDDAFACFAEGNRLHHAANPFDLATQAAHFGRIQEIFDADFLAADKAGDEAAGAVLTPIFIVGMPRSGTSLVEQILASHPLVHGAGEKLYLHEECAREAAAAGAVLPGAMAGFDGATFRRIAAAYLERLKRHGPGAPHITDKMPQNFLYLGVIARAFPGARIIHCRRGAMDVSLSLYKRFFTSPNPWAYDLGDLGGYYRLYEAMMAHWQRLLPGRIFDIAYEDLVADPGAGIRGLLAHCDLAFDPACLDFHKTRRVVATASAVEVRQPIYQGSVGAWKRYEKHLAPLMEALK